MNFRIEQELIKCRLHLKSPSEAVYNMPATDDGRAQFWAENAQEDNGIIRSQFPNKQQWQGKIRIAEPHSRYQIEYFGGSLVTFTLSSDDKGGTDLSMIDKGVPEVDPSHVFAGWVSVLLALKAAVDFKIDLRNHDPTRTWDQGYVDN